MSDEANAKKAANPVQTMREAGKWLVAALGAVGAILIAGVQLAEVGGITPVGVSKVLDYGYLRLAFAMGSFFLGLYFLSLAMNAAVKILKPFDLTYDDFMEKSSLIQKIDSRPTIIGKAANSVADLNQKYENAYAEYYADRESAPKKAAYEVYSEMKQTVLDSAHYYDASENFDNNIKSIMTNGFLIAVSLVVFTVSVKAPPIEVSEPLAEVVVQLTDEGVAEIVKNGGSGCSVNKSKRVDAVLLEQLDGGRTDLIINKTTTCARLRFTLSESLGKID